MKAKLISGTIVILVGVAFLRSSFGIKRASSNIPISEIDNYDQEILDATIQISMVVSVMDETSSVHKIRAKGLGSLVNHNRQILLVTHNHWGELLQDATVIEMYDASHRILKEISGAQFKSLIRYQDAGTLVLEAPEGLTQSRAILGSPIQAGDTVIVAYRQTASGDQVAVLEAIVDSVFMFQGLPTYKLLSLDGQPIRGGDSGGGIWHDGELVGNMWATVEVENSPILALFVSNEGATDLMPTNKSMAAALSMNLQFSPSSRLEVNSVDKVHIE